MSDSTMSASRGQKRPFDEFSFDGSSNMFSSQYQNMNVDPNLLLFDPEAQFQNQDLDLALFGTLPATGLTPGARTLGAWTTEQQAMFNQAEEFPFPQLSGGYGGAEGNSQAEQSQPFVPGGSIVSDDNSNPQQTTDEAPKPKKQRRSRKKKQVDPKEEEVKREKFLKRNRDAAHKCRVKKKEQTQQLQEKYEMLHRDNAELCEGVLIAYNELASLRKLVLAHATCGDGAIDKYLREPAHEEKLRAQENLIFETMARSSDIRESHLKEMADQEALESKETSNFMTPQDPSQFQQHPSASISPANARHHSDAFHDPSSMYNISADNDQEDFHRPSTALARRGSGASFRSGESARHDSGVSNMGSPPEKQKTESVPEDEGFGNGSNFGMEGARMMPNPRLGTTLYSSPMLPTFKYGIPDLQNSDDYLQTLHPGSVSIRQS